MLAAFLLHHTCCWYIINNNGDIYLSTMYVAWSLSHVENIVNYWFHYYAYKDITV